MYLCLGSNIEPRRHLARAVAELRLRFDVVAVSRTYRTAPVGDTKQADFFNLAACIDTDLPPGDVQEELRAIESLLGRRRDPRRPSGPRTADLDLVLVPGVVGRFGRLELPSPLVEREAFVAIPLADLAPELPHPVAGTSLREVAQAAAARSSRPPVPVAEGPSR